MKPRRWRWTTLLKLLFAGWRPNRNGLELLQLPSELAIFPEARRVLSEFGGLSFGNSNKHVCLDPLTAGEIYGHIGTLECAMGCRLYPVGVWEHQDPMYVLVNERGIVFIIEANECRPLASSFDRAIEYIVRQKWDREEKEEDLGRLGMVGKSWRLNEAAE